MLRSRDKELQVHRLLSRAAPVTTARARYEREVLRDTPRAFYPLQDFSGNPVDVSGNGLDFTSTSGSPVYRTVGPFGDDFAIQLPGGSSLNRSTHVSTVTNNFTMELWLRVEIVSSTDQPILHNGNVATNGWGIRMNDGNQYLGLAGGIAELTGKGMSTYVWQHLVMLRDSTDSNRWRYYQNGTVILANAGTSAPGTPSGTLVVGATNAQYSVAYLAIYETALSAARILAHFNAAGLRGTP